MVRFPFPCFIASNSVFVVCIGPNATVIQPLLFSPLLSLLNDSLMVFFSNSIREEKRCGRIWLSPDRISTPAVGNKRIIFDSKLQLFAAPESSSLGIVIQARCIVPPAIVYAQVYISRGTAHFRETRGSYPSSNFQQRRVFVAR